jgi:hypothetical protein
VLSQVEVITTAASVEVYSALQLLFVFSDDMLCIATTASKVKDETISQLRQELLAARLSASMLQPLRPGKYNPE